MRSSWQHVFLSPVCKDVGIGNIFPRNGYW